MALVEDRKVPGRTAQGCRIAVGEAGCRSIRRCRGGRRRRGRRRSALAEGRKEEGRRELSGCEVSVLAVVMEVVGLGQPYVVVIHIDGALLA